MVSLVLKHWITTLVIPPLLILLFFFLEGERMNFEGIYEMYFIIFLFSILFSAPTYILMFAVAYFISREERSIFQKKSILFIISLIGIIISFEIFMPGTQFYFLFSYLLISFLAFLFFKENDRNKSK